MVINDIIKHETQQGLYIYILTQGVTLTSVTNFYTFLCKLTSLYTPGNLHNDKNVHVYTYIYSMILYESADAFI